MNGSRSARHSLNRGKDRRASREATPLSENGIGKRKSEC